MTLRSVFGHVVRGGLTTALLTFAGFANISAQMSSPAATRWTIEPRVSMVWWQVNPHHGHLFATTCPRDENWHPGEGRSAGTDAGKKKLKKKIETTDNKQSLDDIPLFVRDTIKPVCKPAVRGQFLTADGTMQKIRGIVRVAADSIDMGFEMRDMYARRYVFKTTVYKEITVTLDSLSAIQPGDTIRGFAYGTMRFRDSENPIRAPFLAWDEPLGRRVTGQWAVSAYDLINKFHVPKLYLTMGVASKIWDELHMGFDLVLKPETASGDR